MSVKLGQTGTKQTRRWGKTQALKEQAGMMRAQGKTVRQIAGALGVSTNTVPSMLEDSEFWNAYRRRLRDRVPKALKRIDKALESKSDFLGFKAAAWTLEHTQVGVSRTEQAVTTQSGPNPRSMTDEELDQAIAERCQRLGIDRLLITGGVGKEQKPS
jgi:hypothetical protein